MSSATECGTSCSIYRYQELEADNIRLIRLHKSPEDPKTSSLSIIHVHLDRAPRYEAVSYVWGDPGVSQLIPLSDGRGLTVTASVARALPFLVTASETDYLWIDQVTINQDNITERSNQVRIMGEIYGRSWRCLIWIDTDQDVGVEAETELSWSQGAGEDVRALLQSFDYEEIQQVLHSPSTDEPRLSISQDAAPIKSPAVAREHLLWFLEHPWFTRTWVYQEFVLPNQAVFLIGDFELHGHELETFFRLGWPRSAVWIERFHHRLQINKSRAFLFDRAPGMEFLRAAFQSRHQIAPSPCGVEPIVTVTLRNEGSFSGYTSLTFSDMLEAMGASQSRDDRDHVYAFIGFAPFILRHMTVDYSLSVEETFAAMMKALIQEGRNLDFFAMLPSEADISQSTLKLPSWVPNWTVRPNRVPILSHDNLFYSAGKEFGLPTVDNCRHHQRQPPEWNRLVVAGRVIDTISYKLRPYSVYQITRHQAIDVHHCAGNLPWEKSTLDRFLGEMDDFGIARHELSSSKALLRTLLMDGVQYAALAALTSGKPMFRTDRAIFGLPHYERTEDVVSAIVGSSDVDYDNLPHETTMQVLHELSKVQYRRRIVYCANGRFAMTPDWAEKNDLIALLHGSRTPIVLRERKDGNFEVVGQCYYDGAMYGEMADPDDDAADIFTIV